MFRRSFTGEVTFELTLEDEKQEVRLDDGRGFQAQLDRENEIKSSPG